MRATRREQDMGAALPHAILHWDMQAEAASLATTQVRSRTIGAVRLWEIAGGRCLGRRSHEHRARDGGGYVGIIGTLAGAERLRDARREWSMVPGDVMVWRNDGPLEFEVTERARKIVLLVPEDRFANTLKLPMRADRCRISRATPLGGLIGGFLRALVADFEQFDSAAAEAALAMALNLVAIGLDAEATMDLPAARSSLYLRICGYIDRRLEDRGLTPAAIAVAHGISIRYLHRLFAERGRTVSGWIRERRLAVCREEVERATDGLSLTEIAHRWGFSDGAHFSRSFKARYGLPPKLWRSFPETRLERAE